jgi:hypothetical protein
MNEMVSNHVFTNWGVPVCAHGFGTLGRNCGSSQKSFRLMGLYMAVEPFERLNKRNEVRV